VVPSPTGGTDRSRLCSPQAQACFATVAQSSRPVTLSLAYPIEPWMNSNTDGSLRENRRGCQRGRPRSCSQRVPPRPAQASGAGGDEHCRTRHFASLRFARGGSRAYSLLTTKIAIFQRYNSIFPAPPLRLAEHPEYLLATADRLGVLPPRDRLELAAKGTGHEGRERQHRVQLSRLDSTSSQSLQTYFVHP